MRHFSLFSPRTLTSPPKELIGSLRFVYVHVCVFINTYTNTYVHILEGQHENISVFKTDDEKIQFLDKHFIAFTPPHEERLLLKRQ